MLRADKTDVYMDDYQLLEYEVSRMDKDCKVQFVGKGFGSDGYAIGLPKNSWMRVSWEDEIRDFLGVGVEVGGGVRFLVK